MKLIRIVCSHVNSDFEMKVYEEKIEQYLEEGFRLVGAVQVDPSTKGYGLVATLIKHPHFAFNG